MKLISADWKNWIDQSVFLHFSSVFKAGRIQKF